MVADDVKGITMLTKQRMQQLLKVEKLLVWHNEKQLKADSVLEARMFHMERYLNKIKWH